MIQMFAVQAAMSLTDNMTAPLKTIEKAMASTDAMSGRLTAKMAGLTKAMLPLALAAGLVIGALTGTVGATMQTQAALGELASVGVTDMEAMSAAATDFSNKWAGTTKPEFIAAAYDIKSGISTLSDTGVAEFTKLAALTGKATKSTTAEMTSLFATGYGIYKGMYAELSDIQFGEVFSAGISAAVKNFKTTGSQMSAAIENLGSSAAVANVPLAEQLAILGMLQTTMSGSEAGTKYKGIILKAAEAGDKLGLSFMHANGQLMSMPEILDTLRGKFGATLEGDEISAIKTAFGEEAVLAITNLYPQVDALRENIAAMNAAIATGTSITYEMAKTMNMDLGAVLSVISQRWHNLLEIVGKAFLPVSTRLGVALGNIIGLLQRMADTRIGQTLIRIVGVLSLAVAGFTGFTAAAWGLSVAMPYVTAGISSAAGALAALTWPVWVLIGAVAALYLAWQTNFGGIADTMSAWWEKISLAVAGVKAVLGSLRGTTGVISGELAGKIEAAGLVGLVTTVSRVVYRMTQLLGGLWGAFAEVAAGIGDVFLPVIRHVAWAFEPVIKAAGYVARALFGATAATNASAWQTFGQVVGVTVGSVFSALAWTIRILLVPFELLGLAIGAVAHGFVWLGEAIGKSLGWIVTKILNLADLFSGINLFDAGVNLIMTFVGGIKSVLNKPKELIKAGFSAISRLLPHSDAKEGPLSSLTGSGVRMLDTLGAGIRAATPNLVKTVGGALAGVAAMIGAGTAGPGPVPANAGVTHTIERQVERQAAVGDGGRTIVIQGLKVELPNVTNAHDFVDELRKLVESYDG